MSDRVTLDRKKAVAHAWKDEKARVKEGKGTRDWTPKEQREIIVTGRAKGYQGHHMKSVDGHNSKAGDPNNIQFLTRKEHLAAHNGNFKNNTNGYYDPKTGEMKSFGRNSASVETKNLSNPLSDSQKKYALSKEKAIKTEKRNSDRNKAKAMKPRDVKKVKSAAKTTTKAKPAKESKTLSSQRKSGGSRAGSSSTKSKTLSSQRSGKSVAATSGSGVSNGKGTSSGHGASASGHSSSGHSSSGHGGHSR